MRSELTTNGGSARSPLGEEPWTHHDAIPSRPAPPSGHPAMEGFGATFGGSMALLDSRREATARTSIPLAIIT
jgi:hypothetical protein